MLHRKVGVLGEAADFARLPRLLHDAYVVRRCRLELYNLLCPTSE